MTEPRLKTSFWISAVLRQCDRDGIPAALLRRGDSDSGAVLIRLNRLENGHTVYVQQRALEGELVWTPGTGPAPVDEAAANAYVERALKRDPDIWVLEIEDRHGRQHFPGRII